MAFKNEPIPTASTGPAFEPHDDARLSVDAGAVLQLQAAVLARAAFREAAATFATRLADLLGCDRVSVGFVEDGCAEVVAISHGAEADGRQELNRSIAAAMDEAIDQAATVVFPPPADERPRIVLAHAEVVRRNGGSVCSIPLVCPDGIAGAVTLERGGDRPLDAREIALCEQVVSLAGPLLALKRERERPLRARVREALRAAKGRLTGPGEVRLKSVAAGIVVFSAVALLVPMPYHVSAPARLEGSVQRALVAAADGFIQQVSVRPGDAVKAGQVLAELAEQDLQLERSRRESELAQHENAYGTALARADRSLLMVNQAKVAEARAQLELVDRQIERTRIVAPFDGVVISGDLSQSLGAPVQRGNVLMTVAPLDRYRLIVEVDERDIIDVKAGAAGRVSLAALPGDALAFRTERVAPVAVTREGRNFFEVEGKLEAAAGALRPGLQGVARIEAGNRSLAWGLSHRLLVWMRLNLWSWGVWR